MQSQEAQSKQERQKLDFEDDEARRERLGKLFSNISKSDIPTDTPSSPLDLKKNRPHAIPESDVLARVRAFLPDFQASTDALVAQAALDPDAVNVEYVKKGERAVAMDLGLGVYDAPGAKVEGMEGKGFGPVVESDPTGVKTAEDIDGDEDEDVEEEDEEDTSSSESESDSTDDAPVDTTKEAN